MPYSPRRPNPSALPDSTKDPFSFAASSLPHHVLLLHGLTSTPFEVRFFGEALADDGYGCEGPLLAGHGEEHPEQLGLASWEAWMAQTRAAYAALPTTGQRFIVGSSMGGLLALLLAADEPVDGMALLSPALIMQPMGEFGAALMRTPLASRMSLVEKSEPGGDVGDPEGKAKNPTYTHIDPRGVHELDELRRAVLRRLPDVSCPLLVVHGAHDRTIASRSVQFIGEKVQSPWVKSVFLPHSHHILGLDVERDRILDDVRRFFAGLQTSDLETR